MNDFPSYKNIFADIFKSCLVQLFIDSDGKWSVDYLKALPSADATIDKTEILSESIRYEIDYSDIISEAIVNYRFRESRNNYLTATASSNTAKYLHEISRQRSFNTVLIDSADASTIATRLVDIFGDRKGILQIDCKNRFFNNYISDVLQVELEKHVGFAYSKGTENSRSYEIIAIDKTANLVKIKLTDQRGIEQNAGDF